MSMIRGSSRPLDVERGMIGRVLNRSTAGAAAGAVAGGIGGSVVPGLGTGVGVVGGAILGAMAGVASGMTSADPQKLQNRPLRILDMLGEPRTVYVSAEQWRSMQAASRRGIAFDNLPAPLDQQLQGPPPPPVKP
ncbi:MAG: hypothetical protein VKP57_07945 [Candidatus Sericytochromatia bacterium]|nr:hypothetical protein [Candidatus Sericytochromatia bacterium]